MKKIFLIIEREFLTRVKKKSFIIMTILTPILMAAMFVVPAWMTTMKDNDHRTIAVIDQSEICAAFLENTELLEFVKQPDATLEALKKKVDEGVYYAVLQIGQLNEKQEPEVSMYALKQVPLDVQGRIEKSLEKGLEQYKLKQYNIVDLDKIMASVKTKVNIKTFVVAKNGGEDKAASTGISMGISYGASFLIYMFIFLFGGMVMRGVIEEKSSRIVEVIVSSVKPFQLMMGKIIGVASVGLLQFIIWVLLTIALVTVAQGVLLSSNDVQEVATQMSGGSAHMLEQAKQAANDTGMFAALNNVDIVGILVAFLLFFLLGYLFYASMFAAIGSAVENEAETQQLMLPVTIPLILGIFIMIHTFQHPDSALSFWGSMIPFTSPIVMMARIPFGVPLWEVAASLGILLVSFMGMAWLAGKIYRVGILMYGKKTSWGEMWKWIRYKN